MKKSILTLIILITTSITALCQSEKNSEFNLDFESIENGNPIGWDNFGRANYILSLDSTKTKSGKYSTSIEFKEGTTAIKGISFTLPKNYPGKKITLSGYIKTENITEGYAGLWMALEPSIAFENMSKNGIKGTTDWTKYEITLKMNPKKTKSIVIGGLLNGKGKMWLDNLTVTIDGKDITDLSTIDFGSFPADKDKEFEKGSGITNISNNITQIENLKTLGLIWGFLKYYHPTIAKGTYNWDYELFRILPKILNSTNQKSRDSLLISWIENLGEFQQEKETTFKSADVKIEPDLDWINKSNFSEQLTTLLLKVKNAKRPNEHYYIGLEVGVRNPIFKNENPYSSIRYPDAGFRLLSLYRYWNIIQYCFPYKNLIEEDWKNILAEFIPQYIEAKDETEYTLTVLKLIGRIHDSHANIWGSNQTLTNYFGSRSTCVEMTFIENKPVVTGFYDERLGKETGLKIGDIITHIGSKSFEEIITANLKYYPASNYPTQLRNIASKLLSSNDSLLTIEFMRDGISGNKKLKTYTESEITIKSKFHVTDTCFQLINKDISYINNSSLKRAYLPKLWKEIENTKGLIIDLRNYPSDFPIYELSNYLIPKSTPFVKFSKGSIKSPGLFTFTPIFKAGKNNKSYYKEKVVILINEISQSSAEFHSMAYRVNPNTTVIGSTTAGADGNVSQFYLPGGISTAISGIGVYYPDGKETQRIGIIPDIELKPTVLGIKSGKDELIEKAIELINRQ